MRPEQSSGTLLARAVTLRACTLSCLLIIALCWWIAYSEIRTTTTEITCTALPIGAVFALFVVCLVNQGLRRRWPKSALTPPELACVYILTVVGSSVAGIGMVGFLTPAVANPLWFTNQKWEQFAQSVPWSWAPRDPEALRAYYLGQSTLYKWEHIAAWLPPILVWGGFLALLMLTTLCILLLLRRAWVEDERLAFPIAQVPLAMTVQGGGLGEMLRSRALLYGFLIPVVLQSINNLNWLFPSIPQIPVKPTGNGPLDIGARITTPPWNALGYFPLAFHPNTIGLSFLLATDVSFACWFFYLVRKMLDVACTAYGFRDPGASLGRARMPYTAEQGVGAWICIAGLTLWMARRRLREAARNAFSRAAAGSTAAERAEARIALGGVAFGVAGATAFYVWGGLPTVPSLLLVATFLAIVLALTRIRAEVGMAWHFGTLMTPPDIITRWMGPMNFSLSGLSAMAYATWVQIDMRSITTPHFMEGFRIAEQGRFGHRRLAIAMAIALLFGVVVAAWTTLHLYYTYGASTAHVNQWRITMGRIPYQMAEGHLASSRVGPDYQGMTAAGVGALVTLGLGTARTLLARWPFHPAGYALANTFITDLLWFPFFLGWLAKWLTLRFGGMAAYRRALPFYLGLILGDYVIASLWTFVGIALGIDMYRCFPN